MRAVKKKAHKLRWGMKAQKKKSAERKGHPGKVFKKKGGFNTLAVVYNYKKMKYEVLVVSDEKVGDKEIQII
ncbi:hypothetical protein ACIXFL_21600 [Bacteroides fragilis]